MKKIYFKVSCINQGIIILLLKKRWGENVSYTAHSWKFVIAFLQSAIPSFHIEKHLLNIVRTKSCLKSSYHVYFKAPHCCRLPHCIVTWRKMQLILAEVASFLPFLCTLWPRVWQSTSTHVWSDAFPSMLAGQLTYSWNETPDTQHVFSTTQDHFSFCLTAVAQLFPGDCIGTV